MNGYSRASSMAGLALRATGVSLAIQLLPQTEG